MLCLHVPCTCYSSPVDGVCLDAVPMRCDTTMGTLSEGLSTRAPPLSLYPSTTCQRSQVLVTAQVRSTSTPPLVFSRVAYGKTRARSDRQEIAVIGTQKRGHLKRDSADSASGGQMSHLFVGAFPCQTDIHRILTYP